MQTFVDPKINMEEATEPKKGDPVHNPSHYDLAPGMQRIEVIEASLTPEEFAGYCKGNILKYRLRAGEKGNALQCIAKANWYRDRLYSSIKTAWGV